MSKHSCNCSADLEQLRQQHNSLVVDYRNISRKNQMLRNTQATYELRNEELCRQAIKMEASIKQLQCELDQIRVSMGDRADSTQLYRSEKFRRDVNRNQQLNYLIDSKNKDLTFMKQKLRPVSQLNEEIQQLRVKTYQYQQTDRQKQHQMEIMQEKIHKLERQNSFWKEQYNKIINQNVNQSIGQAFLPQQQMYNVQQGNSHQQPKQNESNLVMEKKPSINWGIGATVVNSVMESMKGQELRSTQNTVYSPPPQRQGSYEKNIGTNYHDFVKEASTQHDSQTNSQLSLIQSRIDMLQKQNSSLRNELTSKIY